MVHRISTQFITQIRNKGGRFCFQWQGIYSVEILQQMPLGETNPPKRAQFIGIYLQDFYLCFLWPLRFVQAAKEQTTIPESTQKASLACPTVATSLWYPKTYLRWFHQCLMCQGLVQPPGKKLSLQTGESTKCNKQKDFTISFCLNLNRQGRAQAVHGRHVCYWSHSYSWRAKWGAAKICIKNNKSFQKSSGRRAEERLLRKMSIVIQHFPSCAFQGISYGFTLAIK